MGRYVAITLAALIGLLAGALRVSAPTTGAVTVSGAPDLVFLPPPVPVRETPITRAGQSAPPALTPPEPWAPVPFPAPIHHADGDRDSRKLLRTWGINDELIFEAEGVGRAASREAMRAAAAFFVQRPGQFPLGEIGLSIPIAAIHYFPARPGADFCALLHVRTPAGGIYLLEREKGSWRALPLLEEEAPGLAKAVEVRDVDGDETPEMILYAQGGSGPSLTVTIYSNPAAPTGVRTLWRSGPILRGTARFTAQEGARTPQLQIEQVVTGALTGPAAMPPIRDRYTFRWSAGGYRLHQHQRFASRTFWLSWLLEAAARGDWDAAALAVEPETLRADGLPDRWFPQPLRNVKLPAVWRDEMGAATVFEAPPTGHWLAEYGQTGRIRRLQPFER